MNGVISTMFPEIDYAANIKFFRLDNRVYLWASAASFVLAAIAALHIDAVEVIAVLVVFGTTFGLLFVLNRPARVDVIDESVRRIERFALADADARLAADAGEPVEVDPIESVGYVLAAPAPGVRTKTENGSVHTSLLQVLLIRFGADRLSVYRLVASLVRPGQHTAETHEVAYENVATLDTEWVAENTNILLTTHDGLRFEGAVAETTAFVDNLRKARSLIWPGHE